MPMLRSLRKNLRQIRYYSATPTQSRWTRAMDIALFVSLAVAVPAALIADVMIVQVTPLWEQHGRLNRGENGALEARLLDPNEVDSPWRHPQPYGRFVLKVPQQRGGFPLTSNRRPLPMKLELDTFTVADPDPVAAMTPGSPIHDAIDRSAAIEGGELLAIWTGKHFVATRHWGPLAMNVVFLWFMLYISSTVLIAAVRGGAAVITQRQAARKRYWRDIGRCSACGYDLRGLEFAERCPECGELV